MMVIKHRHGVRFRSRFRRCLGDKNSATSWLDETERDWIVILAAGMEKGWRKEYFQRRAEGHSFSQCSEGNARDLHNIMGPFGKAFYCIAILQALDGHWYLFKHGELYTNNSTNHYIFIIFYCTYHRQTHIHFDGKQMFLHKK